MLKFNRVSKNYTADKDALKEVSFEVADGELVVITGPSGSGKTTLLKLITKEENPTAGEIYFKEDNVNTLKQSRLPYHRRRIGAVFQDYKLLPELNIWENIALALSILGHRDQEIEEKVTDLLKLVDLTDKAYLFPHQLSGGEAQRISIARALSTAPELIFADEPTGNLDEKNSLTIARLLKKINELGTTVIITTHDPTVVKALADARKMTLENGVLTDSKSSTSDTKKKSSDSNKDLETEETHESVESLDDDTKQETEVKQKATGEEKKENTDKEQDKKDKTQDTQKKKSGFNFFGIFGKKKKEADEESQSVTEEDEHKKDTKEVDKESKEGIKEDSTTQKDSPKKKSSQDSKKKPKKDT